MSLSRGNTICRYDTQSLISSRSEAESSECVEARDVSANEMRSVNGCSSSPRSSVTNGIEGGRNFKFNDIYILLVAIFTHHSFHIYGLNHQMHFVCLIEEMKERTLKYLYN